MDLHIKAFLIFRSEKNGKEWELLTLDEQEVYFEQARIK